MTHALVNHSAVAEEVGVFESLDEGKNGALFANLVSVSFSAFDPFGPLRDTKEDHPRIAYSYIGLGRIADDGKQMLPKTVEALTKDFVASAAKCRSGIRATRWRRALEMLEADPLFKEADVTSLSADYYDIDGVKRNAESLYNELSSGHKIVLLTITRLVETVNERSLVLLDEPEAHLHPPLLAAFVRSLSDLLVQRNGVAIIATHSPVVLQEAPKACVWILRRSGTEVRADRPQIGTFGENVGVLTREVFQLEVTHAGFHRILEEHISKRGWGYDDILMFYRDQLGAEARAIVRGLIAARDAAQSED
jgi:hypothetical protein